MSQDILQHLICSIYCLRLCLGCKDVRGVDGYEGTVKNFKLAVYWYKLSADQNDPSGLINLGYCYHHGIGVEQDYPKALDLYTRAKNAGHSYATKRINELLADMNAG